MPTNSEQIVLQVRTEFEAMLGFVLDAPTQTTPSTDAMERSLLRRLWSLGRLLLRLYLAQQAERHASETVTGPDGQTLPYHSQKTRAYHSLFGKVRFSRRYYYQNGQGCFPLDAALNLPEKGVSDVVREWREKLSAYVPYNKVGDLLGGLLGVSFSTRALQEEVGEDAQHVHAYYQQAEAPPPEETATVLVVQADGKGVPMIQPIPPTPTVRRGKGDKSVRKKEAVVTSVYTLTPTPRTPQEVVASLFKQTPPTRKREEEARPKPHNKRLWATLEGKEAALRFTAWQVKQQEGPHIKHRVALTDGSEALQQRVQATFPGFALVLDFIHADEYLWRAANALWGETAPERTPWVAQRALLLLAGQTATVIADLREQTALPTCKASVKQTLLQVAAYYERNRPFMRYDTYLAAGWPIATGVIEGACRHLVKDRCELSGMRWSQPGAEALLRLRCVAENGDWETFHAFRRAQRQQKLYRNETGVSHQYQLADLRLAA